MPVGPRRRPRRTCTTPRRAGIRAWAGTRTTTRYRRGRRSCTARARTRPRTNQTTDEFRYFRGLNGDHLKNGSTRSVTLYTASSSDAETSRRGFVDESWLNGQVFEPRVLRNDNTDVSERSELSSEQTTYDSHIVANGAVHSVGFFHPSEDWAGAVS